MPQFEYPNRKKTPPPDHFLKSPEGFADSVREGVPLAIETGNSNCLHGEYFQFPREQCLMRVFSERIYMPYV